MFAALAALVDPRAVELYDRLRAAYNPFRPPGSLPVPPLEEWQGVCSFCEDFHCRCVRFAGLKKERRLKRCIWWKGDVVEV